MSRDADWTEQLTTVFVLINNFATATDNPFEKFLGTIIFPPHPRCLSLSRPRYSNFICTYITYSNSFTKVFIHTNAPNPPARLQSALDMPETPPPCSPEEGTNWHTFLMGAIFGINVLSIAFQLSNFAIQAFREREERRRRHKNRIFRF